MLTFAIGDVHGCLNELEIMIKKCKEYAKDQKYKFVFTGDYCDRGPNTNGVIDYMINLQKEVETIALCGNHDAMFNSYVLEKLEIPVKKIANSDGAYYNLS